MAWSGSTYRKGNYTTNGWTGDAANNIGIEAGRHDVQDDDFAQGITDCINKNGLNSPTANLSMGGFRHTNVSAAVAGTDYARFDQVLDRGGLQAATANISLGGFKVTNLANGVANSDAATYGQVLSGGAVAAPTGAITMYGAAAAPSGWLLCDGTAVSRTTYAALFAILSTTYGAGDGSTTFNVPNFRQRFPLGKAVSGTGATLGGTGGLVDHTHTVPAHFHGLGTLAVVTSGGHGHSFSLSADSAGAHTHTMNTANSTKLTANSGGFTVREDGGASTGSAGAHTHTISGSVGGADGTHTHSLSGSVGATGSGIDGNAAMTSGANNPPFLVVNYIVKT